MRSLPIPIKHVVAETVGDVKTSGRTCPFQMRCEISGGREDYIVKLWANPELFLGVHNLAREIYGSLLACMLGFETPEIAIVEIEDNLYFTQPTEYQEVIRNSIGYNFGSKFIDGAKIFSPPLSVNLRSIATKVFCFDMLTGNPDRRVGKPNIFQTKEDFILFDHEQAFPYSRPAMILGGVQPSWEYVRTNGHENHIFFSSIQHQDCLSEIIEFIDTLADITDDNLGTIEEQIPEEWRTGDDIANISNYLANTRDNRNLFMKSLQEILA